MEKTAETNRKTDWVKIFQLESFQETAKQGGGSTYKLLNRIDENKEAINAVVNSDDRTGDLEITFVDRVMLRECLTVLTPLYQLTDSLCGENNVTVSSIIPTLEHALLWNTGRGWQWYRAC